MNNVPPPELSDEAALRKQRVAPSVAESAQALAHATGAVDALDPRVGRRAGNHLGDVLVDELAVGQACIVAREA